MPFTAEFRRSLAIDALTGLSTGDAFGNRAFLSDNRVVAPDLPPQIWPWTDDTQMACSVVDVLDTHGTVNRDALASAFAKRAERFRAYGKGAMRFLVRVRHGADWREISAGLFDGAGSWGNGGAMRVTPLGAYFADDLDRAAAEAAASAEVTHAHPEGIAGGIAAALGAAQAAALRGQQVRLPAAALIEAALDRLARGEVRRGLEQARKLLDRPAEEVVRALGNGSRTSAQDTVPFVLWVAATRLDDYSAAVRTCVDAGGDIDTTAAIVGGILAAHHGRACVPEEWLAAREPLPGWLSE